MVQRLILIRHGDLGDRYRGRYVGRTDPPLSSEGRRQAEALAGPAAPVTTSMAGRPEQTIAAFFSRGPRRTPVFWNDAEVRHE